MAEEGALQLTLHPLVIINISDHFTRGRCQSNEAAPRVLGVLIGAQTGRHIEIANSFEVKVVDGGCGMPSGQVGPDLAYLKTRLEQYKKTFPKYEMLGWYSTTEGLRDGDLAVHQGLGGARTHEFSCRVRASRALRLHVAHRLPTLVVRRRGGRQQFALLDP